MKKTSTFSRRSVIGQMLRLTSALLIAPIARAATSKWDSKMEAIVTVEIQQPSFGRYNRPYIAVWLEDSKGKSVRTVGLWVQQGRGSRWIPDLRRWFRNEQDRQAADGGDLATTVSGPTRNPGVYKLIWDGKSDKGALLDQGEYYVCVEAAREHGTYQLIREKHMFASAAFSKSLGSNEEIKEAKLEFRARS